MDTLHYSVSVPSEQLVSSAGNLISDKKKSCIKQSSFVWKVVAATILLCSSLTSLYYTLAFCLHFLVNYVPIYCDKARSLYWYDEMWYCFGSIVEHGGELTLAHNFTKQSGGGEMNVQKLNVSWYKYLIAKNTSLLLSPNHKYSLNFW